MRASILTAVLLVAVLGPLVLGLCGLIHTSRTPATRAPPASTPREWRLTIASALVYAVAFNVTFFVQELFLVLPKAFTPGLRPTLYHNNHTWEGTHGTVRNFVCEPG